jgi:hypothetical protein
MRVIIGQPVKDGVCFGPPEISENILVLIDKTSVIPDSIPNTCIMVLRKPLYKRVTT